jgi:3-keto-disaccharide hydrolase
MRTILFTVPVLTAALLTSPVRADDFLKADNWEGLMDYWKIDGTTVTGASPKEGLKHNTFLCSKQKYKDFEMKFQIRLKGGGDANSGIQIRSSIADAKKYTVRGPQCDIGAGYWGSLYGELFGGMMKMAPAKAVNAKLKVGDFNDYYIKCVGKHVTIKVNDVTTVDDDFEKMPEDGIIAFQLHVTKTPMEVTFKDIEFKELK